MRKLAIFVALTMLLMVGGATGEEGSSEQNASSPSKSLKACFGKCYSKCNVSQPLWCATLCLGQCKHGKSIPDNLCNCTYTCSKVRCAAVGSDPEKIQHCVFNCSRPCNQQY